jgi:biopolymer transport protein ExbB
MKKVFAILSIVAIFSFGSTMTAVAQDSTATAQTTAVADSAVSDSTQVTEAAAAVEEGGMHKGLKQKFIEGGAGWMAPIAFCLIVGLALCIERILYLSLSSTNTKKLLTSIDEAWNTGGVEAALEVCRNTRGPVASIFYQGLSRYDEGIDVVEKSVAS